MRESLCDVCLDPGHCCKKMFISGRGMDDPMSHEQAEHLAMKNGLPFVPTEQTRNKRWYFSCTQLQPDGRCGIYETRPQVCRDYVAGTDPLCVHHWSRDGQKSRVTKTAEDQEGLTERSRREVGEDTRRAISRSRASRPGRRSRRNFF